MPGGYVSQPDTGNAKTGPHKPPKTYDTHPQGGNQETDVRLRLPSADAFCTRQGALAGGQARTSWRPRCLSVTSRCRFRNCRLKGQVEGIVRLRIEVVLQCWNTEPASRLLRCCQLLPFPRSPPDDCGESLLRPTDHFLKHFSNKYHFPALSLFLAPSVSLSLSLSCMLSVGIPLHRHTHTKIDG